MRILTSVIAIMMSAPQLSPIKYTYIGTTSLNPSSSTATFTAHAIGTASSKRLVVVRVATRSGSSISINGCTIGGITARRMVGTGAIIAAVNNTAIFTAVVPTGTTANIVVTTSGSMTGCVIAVSAIENYQSVDSYSAYNGAGGSGTAVSSGEHFVPEHSVMLAVVNITNSSGNTFTWSPPMIGESEQANGANQLAGFAAYLTTEAESFTPRVDWVSSATRSFSSASFRRSLNVVITGTLIGVATSTSTTATLDFGNFTFAKGGIAFVMFTGTGNTARAISSITIGGVAANTTFEPTSNNNKAAMGYLEITAGVKNVTVTLVGTNGNSPDSRVSVWLIENYGSPTPRALTALTRATGAAAAAITLDTLPNGISFYAIGKENTGAVTWSSANVVAMDVDATGATFHHSHVMLSPTVDNITYAETASWTGTTGRRALGASFS